MTGPEYEATSDVLMGGLPLIAPRIVVSEFVNVEAGQALGTLGCFARDLENGRIYAITNQHVVRPLNPKEILCSIGNRIGYRNYTDCPDFCKVCSTIIGRVAKSIFNPDLDIAAIALDPGIRYSAQLTEDNGDPDPTPGNGNKIQITGVNDVSALTDADLAATPLEVRVVGASTQKIRVGRVVSNRFPRVGAIVPASGDDPLQSEAEWAASNLPHRTIRDQILVISLEPDKPFSQAGDSGSAIVDAQGRVIAFLFANGPDYGDGLKRSVACPVAQVLGQLNVEILTFSGTETVPPSNLDGLKDSGIKGAGNRDPATCASLSESEILDLVQAFVDDHGRDIRGIARRNRRVVAEWRRQDGARLPDDLLTFRAKSVRERQLLAKRILRIATAVRRYASSPVMAEDIDWLASALVTGWLADPLGCDPQRIREGTL
jgi:hypothetical protein